MRRLCQAHERTAFDPYSTRSCPIIGDRHAIAFSASFTDTTTENQSPDCGCLNRRAVGYHGLSSRSTSQRQSGLCSSRIHVGSASAPDKCTTEVSEEMTRPIGHQRSGVTEVRKLVSNPGNIWQLRQKLIVATAQVLLDTDKMASGSLQQGGNALKSDRARSVAAEGRAPSPGKTNQFLLRLRQEVCKLRFATLIKSQIRNAMRDQISSVLKARGRLSIGQCKSNGGNSSPKAMTSLAPLMLEKIPFRGACASTITCAPCAATMGM